MNKAEIKQEILDLIGEVSPMMVIPPESIEDAIQFAHDEIAVKLGVTYVETPGIAVDSNGIAILPDSLVKLVRVWFNDAFFDVNPYSIHFSYMTDLSNPQDTVALDPNGDMRYEYSPLSISVPNPSELVIVLEDPYGVFNVHVKSEMLTGLRDDTHEPGFVGSAPSSDWFEIDSVTYPPDFISELALSQQWYRIVYIAPGGSIYGAGIYIDFNVTVTNTETNDTYEIPFRIYSSAV